MFLIFISTEVVKKSKYIYGLQSLTSLKIELLHWCLFFFPFVLELQGTKFKEHFIEAGF